MENSINIDITNSLIVASRAVEKVADIMFSRYGLTMRTYELLMHIHKGVDTSLELRKIMQTTPENIAQKTKILEEKKMIKRLVDDKDKRVWHLSLTKKGQKTFSRIQTVYEHANFQLYAKYPTKQKEEISRFLISTNEHLAFVLRNKNKIDAFVDKGIAFKMGGRKNEK